MKTWISDDGNVEKVIHTWRKGREWQPEEEGTVLYNLEGDSSNTLRYVTL